MVVISYSDGEEITIAEILPPSIVFNLVML